MIARAVTALAIACGLVFAARPVHAQSTGRLRVVETIAATSDAHDVAAFGDRTIVATSGGVAILRGDVLERTLTVRDGLPGLRTRSLSIVSDGIWVGGIDGAARIERDPAGVFRVAETVPIARVQRVVMHRNAIYFATAGGGVVRRDDGSTRLVPVILGHSPAFMHVSDLVPDGDTLWAATVGAGLVGIDASGRASRRVNAQRGLASDLVWRIVRDGDRLLVGTAGGISVVRSGRVDARAPEAAASNTLAVPDVRAMVRTARGLVVATYAGGIARWDAGARRFVAIEGGPEAARAIAEIDQVQDQDQGQRRARREGALVVAHEGGVMRIDARGATNIIHGGLRSADVTSLATAFGALWIGTFDHGLARRDADGTVRDAADAGARWHLDPRINDLARTRDASHGERLWIATDRGLFVHDGRSFVPVVDREGPGYHHVTALHVDATGTLWVAGSEGLFSLPIDRDRWSHVTADDAYGMRPLGAVTTDARGTVWAGGLHGLFEIDARNGHVVRHAVSTSELPVDWVTSVARSANGIVAGTYHGGLAWIEDGHATIEREGRAALPTGWVNPHAMAVVDGTTWFGSLDRGLVTGTRAHWHALTIDDGLPGNDVTAVAANGDGTMWVATRAGIVRIQP